MSYNSIKREDPQAIEKLNKKLNECEQLQISMKERNAYYRKNGTVIGCSCLSTKQAETLDENVRRSYPTKSGKMNSWSFIRMILFDMMGIWQSGKI